LEYQLALTLVLLPLPSIISFQSYTDFQRGLKVSPRDTANNNETALNEISFHTSTITLLSLNLVAELSARLLQTPAL
jgi:hypothetical protein